MTAPAHVASSHYYDSLTGVDDVQDIIDALGTILKTDNDPVWTEPTAGTFQSPVDAYGRYFQVIVSRIDVDTLELVVKDQYGTTIRTNRIDINTGGDPTVEVKIYSGQYHLWIDSMRATVENFRSGLLDLSPQAQDAWSTVVYAYAHRDSAGGASNSPATLNISGLADQALVAVMCNTNARAPMADPGGNVIYWPVFVLATSTGNTLKGRFYQVLVGPSSIAAGTEVTVPIDTGVTAKFRGSGAGGSDSVMSYARFFVRAD